MTPEIDKRLRSRPPTASHVPQSTPVPSFGDPEVAVVATLGINPSCNEFLSPGGALLSGKASRFVSLPEAGVESLEDAAPEIVERVYAGCTAYFFNNPYRRWFDRLEYQVQATGASFYARTAVHLDLAHWATRPIWRRLDSGEKHELLRDGQAFLEWQLNLPNIRLLLLNGRTVINAFADWTGCHLHPAGEFLGVKGKPTSVYTVSLRAGLKVLGWPMNLQSSWGVTTVALANLRRCLGDLTASAA